MMACPVNPPWRLQSAPGTTGAWVTYGVSDDGRDRIAFPYLEEERLDEVNALLRDKPQALQHLEAQIRARKR
jgi:hypothetical protein